MAKSVFNIHFQEPTNTSLGFQVLSLKDLFQRTLDHALNRPHRLQFYLILFITQGSGKHTIDFETYSYEPGTMFFISKYQIHYFDVKPQNDGYMILFTEGFLYKTEAEIEKLQRSRVFDDQLYSPQTVLKGQKRVEFERMLEELALEYQRENDSAKEEILRSFLRIFILKAERLKKSERSRDSVSADLRLFMKLVDENHTKCHHVIEYADMIGKSPKTISKMTLEALDQTPKQYIDSRIILEAKRLLTHTPTSVKELAYQLGFSEPTNFVKFFRSRVHMSPKQFRTAHQ